MQPQILLLKEGVDTSQGKGQIVSNINACSTIVDTIKTTLGPRGMDKLIVNKQGRVTISNDGATIMKLLEVVHPAASILVEIAKAQDAEVGDGTTSVVLLAGELLKEAKTFIEEGMHPQVIIKSYRDAKDMAIKYINEIAIPIAHFTTATNDSQTAALRSMLEKCASTSMNSKLVGSHKEFFTKMVVDAVLRVRDEKTSEYPLEMIGIKKVTGGAMKDSMLVDGVAFKKTFSYAGFEMQPKSYKRAKIAILNIELELKAERDNAEIRVDSVEQYQRIVDAEWTILYNKLDTLISSGASIVLSKLPIGDVATQYFADRDVFCAGRVCEDDIQRTIKACGGRALSSIADGIPQEALGFCSEFEEVQIGDDRFNIFKTTPESGLENEDGSAPATIAACTSKSVTLILRGGADQFIAETERSLHDAIMVVRRLCKTSDVVVGGGAIEMALSKHLREESKKISKKPQLLISRYAKALEVIPRQLCENAGLDSTNILNVLRNKHSKNEYVYGVDIAKESVANNLEKFVLEPKVLKINALSAATEACCSILSIDETISHPKNEQPDGGPR